MEMGADYQKWAYLEAKLPTVEAGAAPDSDRS
jgi:hypothetical protein